MYLSVGNKAREKTSTSGPGTYSLDGIVSTSYITLASALIATMGGSGPWLMVPYHVTDGIDYEIGYGPLTDDVVDTLTRERIVESSNSNNAVSWLSTVKTVILGFPPAQWMRLMSGVSPRLALNDNGSAVAAGELVKVDSPENSFMKTVAGDEGTHNKYSVSAWGADNAAYDLLVSLGYVVVNCVGTPVIGEGVSASGTAGKVKTAVTGDFVIGYVVKTAGLTNQVGVVMCGWRESNILKEHNAAGTHKPTETIASLGLARKNFVINGAADVMQVGAYPLVKDVYGQGSDMFMGMATGTAVSAGTFSRTTGVVGTTDQYAFHFSSITLTSSGIIYLRGRIEAQDCYSLKNATCTFSCLVKHDVGSNVNFTLYVRKANVSNNFSAVTEIGNSGATAVVTATSTRLTFTVAMGNASNGVELEIKAEVGAVTTKNVYIGEVQLEKGSERTDFERMPVALTRVMCQRYWQQSYNDATAAGTSTQVGVVEMVDPIMSGEFFVRFGIPMRTTPTVISYSRTGASGKYRDESSSADFDATPARIGQNGFVNQFATSGAADETKSFHYTADARLL